MNENSLDFTKAILKKFDITDNDVCVVNIKPIKHNKRFSTINKNGKWTVSDTFNCVIYVTTNSSALIIENTNVQTLFGNTTKGKTS